MKTNWTRADDNRAAKMGWYLEYNTDYHDKAVWITRSIISPFKTDTEAIEWVMNARSVNDLPPLLRHRGSAYLNTCRKAIFLCCRGGAR